MRPLRTAWALPPLTAALLVACGDGEPPAPAGPRLLDGPFQVLESAWDPARIRREGPAKGLPATLGEEFEETGEPSWLAWELPAPFGRLSDPDRSVPVPRPPTASPAAAAHGGGGLRFPEASGGALWVVPILPDTPYDFAVQVRRSLGDAPPEAAVGHAVLVELAAVPAASGADLFQAVLEADQVSLTVLAPGPVTDGFQPLRRVFRSSVYSKALAVFLSAGDPGWWLHGDADQRPPPPGTVDFDDLRLTRLSMRRYLAVQDLSDQDDLPMPDPEALQTGSEAAFLRPLKLLGDVRRSVLAPPDTRLAFPLSLPPGPHLLTLGFGVLEEPDGRAGPTPLRFQVHRASGDGRQETLLDRSLEVGQREDQGWHDLAVQIEGGDGDARLLLEVTAAPGATATGAFAEPMVQPVSPPQAPRPPNVILISLDTLRADRLGCYGYRRDGGPAVSPRIDALARRSWLFEQARTVAPFTLPSHATIMTGWWPALHGVQQAGRHLVRDLHPLLAVQLAQAGYATAGFTGGGYVSHEYGFHLGFDRYSIVDPMLAASDPLRNDFPRPGDREGNDAVYSDNDLDSVERWIQDRRDVPFFLFLHTFLVHNYHAEPQREAAFVRQDPLGFAGGDRALHPIDLALAQEGAAPPAELLQVLGDLYDATIQEADAHVGRLLDFLEQCGLAEDTVVILLSDHGEEFGEHGGLLHGRTVYEEVLRVPLIVHLPGQAPVRVPEAVDLADVAPTILRAVGLEPPPVLQGAALQERLARGVFRDETVAEVDAVNLSTRRALLRGRRKLVVNPETAREESGYGLRRPPPQEWYDLSQDPGEQDDLRRDPGSAAGDLAGWETLRDRLEAIREEMTALQRALIGEEEVLAAPAMSPEQRRLLERLGYAVGGRQD